MKIKLLFFLGVVFLFILQIRSAGFSIDSVEGGVKGELNFTLDKQGYRVILERFEKIEGTKYTKQENFYFDTLAGYGVPNFLLNQNGINLRLRVKEGKAEITLKVSPKDRVYNQNNTDRGQNASFLFIKEEYKCKLENADTAGPIIKERIKILSDDTSLCTLTKKSPGHPLDVLKQILYEGLYLEDGSLHTLMPDKIVLVAQNKTLRTTIPLDFNGNRVKLDVDKTLYPHGYVGYEVEIGLRKKDNPEEVISGLLGLLSELNIHSKQTFFGKATITFILQGEREEETRELIDSGIIGLED
jgi:hypothetical protein